LFGLRFHADRSSEVRATAIYRAIVAQARAPALYSAFGVPDSVTGRFEMVVLHTVLVLERLKRCGSEGKHIGQEVFDAFCRDMDQSLRELGFGDMAVPKRMKRIGESFYGRAEAYSRSLGNPDGLAEAIARNIFGEGQAAAALGLARYVSAAARHLSEISDEEFLAGRLLFPDAAAFARTDA
jgi:cytochrome b pre-mRNA-processing protein 3